MNTGELKRYSRTGPDWIEARIELHRRLALPLACIMLALVGIPLGISSRKGGKSAGYVTALFLAFFCYYLAFISLIGMAKQRTLPVEVAVWTPNAAFMLAGLILIARLERPGRPRPGGHAAGLDRGRVEAPAAALRHTADRREFARAGRRWLPLAAADRRYLRPLQLPVLLRRAAGQLRHDDARSTTSSSCWAT